MVFVVAGVAIEHSEEVSFAHNEKRVGALGSHRVHRSHAKSKVEANPPSWSRSRYSTEASAAMPEPCSGGKSRGLSGEHPARFSPR